MQRSVQGQGIRPSHIKSSIATQNHIDSITDFSLLLCWFTFIRKVKTTSDLSSTQSSFVFLDMQMCYILKVFFNAKSKAKFFFIKTNGSCAHAVSMRCALEQTAVSSTLSRVLPPFGRGSLKLAIPSELEKSRLQCLHRSFSQKHRHHNWDDLEVPLSNKGLRSTALSWDNHLYTLVCHEAAQVSFGFQSVQLLVMTPTFT